MPVKGKLLKYKAAQLKSEYKSSHKQSLYPLVSASMNNCSSLLRPLLQVMMSLQCVTAARLHRGNQAAVRRIWQVLLATTRGRRVLCSEETLLSHQPHSDKLV